MAGVTPDEGKVVAASRVYNTADLVVGLFTNSSGLDAASEWADITQPVGNGYAEVTIPAGSFNISAAGVVTLASLINFVASGGNIGPVYGAYIRTIEATPRLLHFEVDPNAPVTALNGQTYTANLSNVVS